jgi:acyl carrier protein
VTRQQIRERVVKLASEMTEVPSDEITDASAIDWELRMNSVALMELQVAIEEEYQIEIDPIRVVELNQFGAIVDYICALVADGTSSALI